MHFILVYQIGFLFEVTNLYESTCNKLFRIRVKNKCSCTFEIITLYKTEFVKKSPIIVLQIGIIHTSASLSIFAK